MLISIDEINKSISRKGWSYESKSINKTFKFDSYIDGVKFVNKIAEIAELKNHHPDISIGWCKVKVTITSHDLGGVSTKCVNLALDIDLINEKPNNE